MRNRQMKVQAIHERPPITRIKHDPRAKNLFKPTEDAMIDVKKEMGSTLSLTETNQLIYATATAITQKLGEKPPKPHTQKGHR